MGQAPWPPFGDGVVVVADDVAVEAGGAVELEVEAVSGSIARVGRICRRATVHDDKGMLDDKVRAAPPLDEKGRGAPPHKSWPAAGLDDDNGSPRPERLPARRRWSLRRVRRR